MRGNEPGRSAEWDTWFVCLIVGEIVHRRDVMQFVNQVLRSCSDGTEDLHQSIQGLSARAEPLLCHLELLLLLLQYLLVTETWMKKRRRKSRDQTAELQQLQPPVLRSERAVVLTR